jgi:hypothetical protein
MYNSSVTKLPKLQDMRFGIGNMRSLYRAGSLVTDSEGLTGSNICRI